MKLLTILLVAATVFTSLNISVASAGENQKQCKKRQLKQSKRIGQGRKSGELTRKEAKQLGKNQKRTRKMKRKFKEDGKITKKEKQRLHKAQNRNSKMIYKKKHNKRSRKES